MNRRKILQSILIMLSMSTAAFAAGSMSEALAASEPSLVIDLDPGSSEISSAPRRFVYDADLRLTLFAATTPATGTELWSWDGTQARRVADLCVGPCSSQPWMLANHAGKVFFVADDGVFGRELWSTDGTKEGTKRLADVCPGPCSSMDRSVPAVIFQDRVVFPAEVRIRRDGPLRAFWSSDGTVEGTSSFLDLADVCVDDVRRVRAGTETLYWNCDDKVFAAGAQGESQMVFEGPNSEMEVLGDELFFLGYTPEQGGELWRGAGVGEGSFPVVEFVPGPGRGIRNIYGVMNDCVVLTIEPSGTPYCVNRDEVRQISSRPVEDLVLVEDRVFFSYAYFDSVTNDWRKQLRTAQGPGTDRLLLDRPWLASYFFGSASSGGELFFILSNTIWTSDGTVSGTAPAFVFRDVDYFVDFTDGGRVLTATTPGDVIFSAEDGRGFELWTSDGTSEGTEQVADLVSRAPAGGSPENLTGVGDRAIFTVDGSQLWSTDGTQEGSFPIQEGPQKPRLFFPHQVDGEARLFYSNDYGGAVSGLWSTDGTSTELLTDRLRSVRFAAPLSGGRFLLEAAGDNVDEVGAELWTSDLTNAGTEFLAQISPGYGGLPSPPPPLPAGVVESVLLKDLQIFAGGVVDSFAGGELLWASDGSASGTVFLTDGEPRDLTRVRKHFVLFAKDDAIKGRELWRTNGTPAGTRRVKDLLPGRESSNPHDFARIRPARVLFFALNENGGESLWRTSGSPGGTREIVDLSIDDRPSFVLESELIGDRLYFVLANETTGAELWVTDGTAAGTALVREMSPGPESSDVRGLTAYGDLLLFTARDAESGLELWTSDGTFDGTVRITDVAPGPASSTPEMIRVVGDAIYFRADDGETGRELWVLKPG